MGIRETLNRNSKATATIAATAIVIALLLIFWGSDRRGAMGPQKAFYTTDDGATTFVDDNTKYPPFEHEGREAVRAYKFACTDGKEFVAYLERYTPEAKEALERARKTGAEANMELQQHFMLGREVKRPGPAERWKGSRDVAYSEISTPMCRDGMQPQSVGP